MDNQDDRRSRNAMLVAFAVLAGWFGISAGIYSILTGEPILGIVWFAATAVFVVATFRVSSETSKCIDN